MSLAANKLAISLNQDMIVARSSSEARWAPSVQWIVARFIWAIGIQSAGSAPQPPAEPEPSALHHIPKRRYPLKLLILPSPASRFRLEIVHGEAGRPGETLLARIQRGALGDPRDLNTPLRSSRKCRQRHHGCAEDGTFTGDVPGTRLAMEPRRFRVRLRQLRRALPRPIAGASAGT